MSIITLKLELLELHKNNMYDISLYDNLISKLKDLKNIYKDEELIKIINSNLELIYTIKNKLKINNSII